MAVTLWYFSTASLLAVHLSFGKLFILFFASVGVHLPFTNFGSVLVAVMIMIKATLPSLPKETTE